MTSLTTDHQVFKSDTRGRVRTPPERREALLDEFERSSLSGVKFAALAGIKYATFAVWRQKREKARLAAAPAAAVEPAHATAAPSRPTAAPGSGGRASAPAPLRLWEAFVETGPGLQIELPGGARVRVESPGQLPLAAELLSLLAPTSRAAAVC